MAAKIFFHISSCDCHLVCLWFQFTPNIIGITDTHTRRRRRRRDSPPPPDNPTGVF